MNKRITILLIGIGLIALPALAVIKGDLYILGKAAGSERCSNEVESLKLCVENPKIVVNSGEPVRIKVFWANASEKSRRIGNRSSGYSVTVNDKSGNKLIPVFEQKFIEKQNQLRKIGEEDKGVIMRITGGGDRGLHIEAKGIEKDEILLNDKMYDYDLTSKGIYYVTISKKIASLEKGKNIEFVLNGIEIQVK